MIYSKKNNFLFIKGMKVAGTSVEMALAAVCGSDDIIAPITRIDEWERLRSGGRGAQNYSHEPEKEQVYLAKLRSSELSEISDLKYPKPRFRSHMSLQKFIGRYGSLPTDRIFCVERSPYAKIISSANMRGRLGSYKSDGRPMDVDSERLRQTLENMIERKFRTSKDWGCYNIDQYRGVDGAVRIRALRYEALEQDFAGLMTEYGISPAPPLPHAKSGAKSNDIDPREFFTRDQLDKINSYFAEEFDTFGYARL